MTSQQTVPPFNTLNAWLNWLENTRPETEIELGLERISQVAEALKLNKPAPFVITVGGTNGKGSTVTFLESILLEAGYRVGVYTSPHIERFNERVKVDGQEVPDQWLSDSFTKIHAGQGDTWLSYFEFAVLSAVDCFQKAGVDIAIMEVGLGGRLDATNMIDPDVSVITTIGLDHQDYLGYTTEAIGREKAGIMRKDKPAVFGALDMPNSVQQYSVDVEAALHRRGKEFDLKQEEGVWHWQGLSKTGEALKFEHLPVTHLVIDNAATAIQALQFVSEPPNKEAIVAGLASAKLAGRYEVREVMNTDGKPVTVILDVAHNPQAAIMLRNKLTAQPIQGKTRAVLAMYADKDCAGVVEALADEVDEWVVSEFDSPRALAKEQLAEMLEARHLSITVETSVLSAYNHLLTISQPEDRILVTGSFMTVATV